MPFTKVAPDKYKSPSGKTFDTAQVKLYYATNGFKQSPGRDNKPNKKRRGRG